MNRIIFSELDRHEKRKLWNLAEKAGTLSSFLIASVQHLGELWAADEFFDHFPKGTVEHAQLAERFRHGTPSNENILDCIARIAPSYVSQEMLELDEMMQSTAVTYDFYP